MKLFWEQSELEVNFTLNTSERKILSNRTNVNQLGLAILMKYVQYEHRFPNKRKEIPIPLIKYIAEQLNISAEEFKNYNIQTNKREIKRHRAIIRQFYNIRKWDKRYFHQVYEFIIKLVLPDKIEIEDIRNAILKFLYDKSIEPPRQKPLTRIINSILNFWENEFFEKIYNELSSKTKKQLNNLLKFSNSEEDINISNLRHNSGTVSAASFKFEAAKLQILRRIPLTEVIPIFEEIPKHILNKYKNRILTEPIREIKRQPSRIKYAFLSIFVYIRRIETLDYLLYDYPILSINCSRCIRQSVMSARPKPIRKQLNPFPIRVPGYNNTPLLCKSC